MLYHIIQDQELSIARSPYFLNILLNRLKQCILHNSSVQIDFTEPLICVMIELEAYQFAYVVKIYETFGIDIITWKHLQKGSRIS